MSRYTRHYIWHETPEMKTIRTLCVSMYIFMHVYVCISMCINACMRIVNLRKGHSFSALVCLLQSLHRTKDKQFILDPSATSYSQCFFPGDLDVLRGALF